MLTVLALIISGSEIHIAPTEQHGAEAVITFDNNPSNGLQDNKSFVLTLNELVVTFDFRFNSGAGGADSIDVVPPDGMVCLPSCTLELMEGYSGQIFLIPWSGM